MAIVHSISLCARVTLDLHSLNNEGTEGNQQQTRMVHIIDQKGKRAVVNAVSGDMFKHILVEHLIPLLREASQPLSVGASVGNPDRVNIDLGAVLRRIDSKAVDQSSKKWLDQAKKAIERRSTAAEPADDDQDVDDEKEDTADTGRTSEKKKPTAPTREIAAAMVNVCALTDIAGTLLTMKKPGLSLGRKSVVEFGWVVGLPEDGAGQPLTTTEQYFHVKYAPEGRGAAAGGETVAGTQAIFHRPASSGVYALICGLDLYRIGLNDITRQYVVDQADRVARGKAVIQALAATLLKPAGAQRNTQNPHIVACEGIVAVSRTSLPAPTVSPLSDAYRTEMQSAAQVLNRIRAGTVEVKQFESISSGVEVVMGLTDELELPA